MELSLTQTCRCGAEQVIGTQEYYRDWLAMQQANWLAAHQPCRPTMPPETLSAAENGSGALSAHQKSTDGTAERPSALSTGQPLHVPMESLEAIPTQSVQGEITDSSKFLGGITPEEWLVYSKVSLILQRMSELRMPSTSMPAGAGRPGPAVQTNEEHLASSGGFWREQYTAMALAHQKLLGESLL